MRKCLVVDDVEVSRYAAQILLEEMNFQVEEASSPDDARKKLMMGRPDVILLDWHLRKVSGLDFLREIKSHNEWKSIPVVVYSGVEENVKSSEAIAAGAVGFLQKPTTRDKLHSEFARLGLS